VLLPELARQRQVRAACLVTATGASARRSAERFGFERCGTDPESALQDDVDLVFIATAHDSHAALAARALRAGKAVWLEKPPALDDDQLQLLSSAARETGGFLAIGYNRRFSHHTQTMRAAFARRAGPLAIHYSVAAGRPPRGTWIVDPAVGGGRIVGEVCHFVDWCAHLVGSAPVSVHARALARDPEVDDSMIATLGFGDGSAATIQYLACASPALPKERIEASAGGTTLLCEDFRRTWRAGGRAPRGLRQDKGQAAALTAVLAAVRSGAPSPFALSEIEAISRATFAMLESLRSGQTVGL
jgi:predicted dehydrogenase